MAFLLTNTDNVTDDATLALDFAWDATTAAIGGTTYLFVTGVVDDGVSVFSVAADGTLANVDNVTDDATLELDGAAGVATAVVNGTTYLFVAASAAGGVSVFSVAANGTLANVDNVTDDATLELAGALDVATALVGGTTYLFVTGFADHGVSVFSVAADGTLTNVDNVPDAGALELAAANGVTTAVVGGTTYLFVAGQADDGVSVFAVAADGTLTNVDNVTDDATLELDGAFGVASAVVGGATYLFVIAGDDSGVSVFAVASDGTLTNVDNVTDDAMLELNGATDATTAVIDGTTHLFVTGFNDDGLSVFSVAAGGALTNVLNVVDDATLELDGASGATTAVVGGAPYLFATGLEDDGVSVFSLTEESALAPGDVVWRHSDGRAAIASGELGSAPTTWEIEGTGDFDADGDGDILWRHQDGLVVSWELANGQFFTTHNLAFAATTWRIDGTGDFDGDGDADVLWRHRDGDVVTWEMENNEFVINRNVEFASINWRTGGTGDFDGDGDDDILWHHRDGMVVTWEMEDGEFVMYHSLPSVANTWQIDGTGDFDADGDADILWRHRDGDVVTWEMENGAYVVNHNIGAAATAWHIRGTWDFDSDGDADILWRHDDGSVETWHMEDGAPALTESFGVVANAWQIRGTDEFDLI